MKQVTITKAEAIKKLNTFGYGTAQAESICIALGLTDPPKRKVKLLAYLDMYGELRLREYANDQSWMRVPSEDREVEICE